VVGDLCLLAVGAAVLALAPSSVTAWHYLASCLSVAMGAWLMAVPFILEYRAALRLAEAAGLASTVGQLQQLETIADRISHATGLWQSVQEHAGLTNAAAREITEKMAAEARGFAEFLQKANETERAHLRLEVEKLRRGEGEWLQVVVRILDHVYALFQAAVRSGQPQLVQQLGHFQNACRDAARRVGLVAFAPGDGDVFDPLRHQLAEGTTTPAEGAPIGVSLAPGYSFQGQLLRRALVALPENAEGKSLSIRELNEHRAQGTTLASTPADAAAADALTSTIVQEDLPPSPDESNSSPL
jgi:molecular chaperone GrpE (heat shock protein)